MKYEEIHELLDRYWEGETTLEEERRIKTYFSAGPIDERLQSVAPMFRALREEQAVQFATKAKTAPMRPQMYQWAAAATVAMLMTAGWWICNEGETKAPQATQALAEQAKSIEKQSLGTPQNAIALVEKTSTKTIAQKKKIAQKRRKPQPAIDSETAQAMAEIKAALALVSAKLDKGRNEAVKGASHLDAMDKIPKRKEG